MLNLPVHELVTDYQRLRRENDILRGLVARQPMPCHYCGKDLSHCPYGFPGCALADDLMCGDDEMLRSLVERKKELEQLIESKGTDNVSDDEKNWLAGKEVNTPRLIKRLISERDCAMDNFRITNAAYVKRDQRVQELELAATHLKTPGYLPIP